ncbi:FkbM family methyltransferase [Candidatus Omnitrophota bacterium]
MDYKCFIKNIESSNRLTLIDVGAAGGIPSKWNYLIKELNVIAFEPDPREFKKLKGCDNIKYLNYALYKHSQDLTYYVTNHAGKSSLLKPNFKVLQEYEDVDRFRIVKEKTIPASFVKSIDTVILENSLSDIDFIKLDTQGSDLDILKGGQKKLIPKIFGAQIEVEFIEMYEGQPIFRDIDEFMRGNGFALMDIRRHYWKRKDFYDFRGKGQLIFADVLYLKDLEQLHRELSEINDNSYKKSKIFKNILICLVYKIFDYAIAVAKTGRQLKCLSEDEYLETVKNIKQFSSKSLLSKIYLPRSIYKILFSVLQKIGPRSFCGWADADSNIGNINDD